MLCFRFSFFKNKILKASCLNNSEKFRSFWLSNFRIMNFKKSTIQHIDCLFFFKVWIFFKLFLNNIFVCFIFNDHWVSLVDHCRMRGIMKTFFLEWIELFLNIIDSYTDNIHMIYIVLTIETVLWNDSVRLMRTAKICGIIIFFVFELLFGWTYWIVKRSLVVAYVVCYLVSLGA